MTEQKRRWYQPWWKIPVIISGLLVIPPVVILIWVPTLLVAGIRHLVKDMRKVEGGDASQ